MNNTYDSFGRVNGMTRCHQTQGRTLTWVNNVIYGAANELKQIHYLATIGDQVQTFDGYMRETRTYNNRLQMTRMQVIWPFASLPGLDQEYRYSATADNGQITQRKDYAPGADEITYQYDSLNRLISATTTGPEWGLSFSYDGFGNRTGQNVTKGSAPVMNLTYNDQTNRVNPGHGFFYDNNGNTLNMPGLSMTYDYDNRLTSATQSSNGTEYYNYSPDNKRIWKKSVQSSGTIEVFYCYGADGSKIGRYQVSTVFWGGQYRLYFTAPKLDLYFGGKKIRAEETGIAQDRLGSNGRYFPYGEPRIAGSGPSDSDGFATYFRDGLTGLDYAINRSYSSTHGRFASPDPYDGSTALRNPSSWNRYAYVSNDPVNFNDPLGLAACPANYQISTTYGGVTYVTTVVYVCLPGLEETYNAKTFSTEYNSADGSLSGMQGIYESGGCATSNGLACWQEYNALSRTLDYVQAVLDIAGLVPGAGEAFDLASAILSGARGDGAGAVLSLAAMAPIGGQAATGVKALRRL